MKIVKSHQLEYLPANSEDQKNPGVWKKILVHKGELIKGIVPMINWVKIPTGRSLRAHYHEDMEEVFIMLKGKANIQVDQEREIVERGDTIIIPTGVTHAMENIGGEDVEFIAIGISLDKGGKTVISEKP